MENKEMIDHLKNEVANKIKEETKDFAKNESVEVVKSDVSEVKETVNNLSKNVDAFILEQKAKEEEAKETGGNDLVKEIKEIKKDFFNKIRNIEIEGRYCISFFL